MDVDQLDHRIRDTLVEMTFAWTDIERDANNSGALIVEEDFEAVGEKIGPALTQAFRVEAVVDHNDFGDEIALFYIFFNVEDADDRACANLLRNRWQTLKRLINAAVPLPHVDYTHEIRLCSIGTPSEGLTCGRFDRPPPKKYIDVADVPVDKPSSNVPLIERDGYWLTPIEVPFYEALRKTGVVFAVQPWIQGVERRYRLDFLIFYNGGMVAVELDGHDSHKTKEQRTRDASRDRWFAERRVRTLRWTGSEVHANPQECVRQLLAILRGNQSRP